MYHLGYVDKFGLFIIYSNELSVGLINCVH